MNIEENKSLNDKANLAINKLKKRSSFIRYAKRNYGLYLMLISGLVYLFIFHYIPMYGIVLAFKDFDMFAGENPFISIIKSPWVGLKVFKDVFSRPDFYNVFRNTLIISTYKIFFLFPLPIILAILLNEVKNIRYEKGLQVIIYLPHFLSWAIVSGIFIDILGTTGIVNKFLSVIGQRQISFLMDKSVFRSVLVFTDGWKEIGWGSIIYLAAIASIDQEQYEAAIVDGANKFQRIINITLPGMIPTIVMMLILRLGSILDAGFGQIFVMYNPTVYDVADIIGTYVYRMGLGRMNFSLGTAVGLFNSVVGFILIVGSNFICKKFLGRSIW